MCHEYWREMREKEAEELAKREAQEAIRKARSGVPAEEKPPVKEEEPAAA